MKFDYKHPVARVVIVLISLILLAVPPTLAQRDPLPLPPSPEDRANVWAVTLVPGASPDAVAARMGLINGGAIPGTPNTYAFREPGIVGRAETETMQAMSAGLATSPDVVVAVQQELLERTTRVPSDPGYTNQWHLNNTGQFGGIANNDVNVEAAWAQGYTGAGVVVASVDDGLWHNNPDLTANYLSSASWDFGEHNPDPSGGWHGTSVGGVMAAVDNGACGVGAAYNADLAGVRILNAPTDANEAQALSNSFENIANSISFAPIDIFNNSWGPHDDGTRLEGPGPLTEAALADGVASGRGGLGSIYVWAAGNGGNNDSVNADGYANSRYTIAVAASNDQGQRSAYSEHGSPILINAPSDDYGRPGIRTTAGSSSGCTTAFGGTSSASPLAAGVIALMLEANPTLTWRDVQHILVHSAEQNDPADESWDTNGAGLPFSHYYGFGRIDAGAAVALADTWVSVAPETSLDSGTMTVNTPIPDGLSPSQPGPWVTSTFNVTQNVRIEAVDVFFDADHGWRGDLQVELISPSGMTSVLMHGRTFDDGNNYNMWRFGTVAHWDEASLGTWTIRVRDLRTHASSPNTGTFKSWRLKIYGTVSGSTVITRQPTSTEVLFDESVSLSIEATGGEPITYQWYTGPSGDTSNPIPGATSSTYTTPPLQSDLQVWVRATGSETSIDSAPSALTVINEVAMLADERFNDTGFNDWTASNNEARIICGKQYASASCSLKLKNTMAGATSVTQRVPVGQYPWSWRVGDTLKVTGMFKASAGVDARLRLMIDYTSPEELALFSKKVIVQAGWQPLEIVHVIDRTDIRRIRVRLKDKSTVIGAKMFADDIQLVHQRGSGARMAAPYETTGEQLLPPPAAPAEFRGGN
jgi:subtilisin family serine protease